MKNRTASHRSKLLALGRDESAQALTESVIMLSLFGFAWFLCYFSLFMANNGIRLSAAARHMAWMEGNGITTEGQISAVDPEFFAYTGYLDRKTKRGSVATGGLSVGGGTVLGTILGWGMPRIHHVDAEFGVHGMDDPNASHYPFIFLKAEFPFMPDSLLNEWLLMEASCEWDPVYHRWHNAWDFVKSLLPTF